MEPAIYRHYDNKIHILITILELFRDDQILVDKTSDIINRTDNILATIIIDGQAKGEIRFDIEAKYLATIIMGSLRLFVKKWQFSGFSYNLPIEGKNLYESIKLLITKENTRRYA
jgi:hypothetical protein